MKNVRFFQLHDHRRVQQLSVLLDSAFQVKNYTASFPHVFSSESSARIFVGVDSSNRIVATCAVDTEVWTEPAYVRGACIGSVAVDPDFQGQGLGRHLLTWVFEHLQQDAQHDFAYLFSDKARFYEALGFRTVGTEILSVPVCSSLPMPSDPRLSGDFVLRGPIATKDLRNTELNKLWAALERGRRAGESHASLAKTRMIFAIPEMLVSWIEGQDGGAIHAGAFVGKGVDFQGVIHTLFADHLNHLEVFWNLFSERLGETLPALLVAAGSWHNHLGHRCVEKQRQNLCLVKPFSTTASAVSQFINDQILYPRALFSS